MICALPPGWSRKARATSPPSAARAAPTGARHPLQPTSFCPAPSKHLGKQTRRSRADSGSLREAAWFPGLAVCPSSGHNEPTFPQATLSSDGMFVTALLATVWHTSVDKKISRCSDGVARKESCPAWRARSFHAVLQGAPLTISMSTRGKGHFIAGPNSCKPVAHTCTPDLLCSFPQHACMSESLE